MTRQILNYIVDAISALVMFGLIATGLIVKYVLPGGGGSSRVLWSLGRHDWGDVHFWIAIAGAVLVCFHVALHWSWICTTTRRLICLPASDRPSRLVQNSLGIAMLLVICGGFTAMVFLARGQVTGSPGGRGENRGHTEASATQGERERNGGNEIRGSMTLAEAANALGHSPTELIAALKLPESTQTDVRLGQLRQEYGFSMSDVREAFGASLPSREQ